MLTLALTRKYKALLYFVKVPKERLAILINHCEYCLNMSEPKRYTEIQRDYEDQLGMKLVPQHMQAMMEEHHRKKNTLDNNAMLAGSLSGLSNSSSNAASLSSNNYTQSIQLNGSINQNN